jgi:hypothetical protein
MTNGFHPKTDEKQDKPLAEKKSAISQPPKKKADGKTQARKKE